MVTHLSRNWWIVTLRGLFAILFGLLVLFQPGISLQALIILLSAYLLVDGISNVINALRNQDRYTRWWVLSLEGVVSIFAGTIAFVWPAITALAVLYVIAAWAILTGVLELAAAIRLREEMHNEWVLALSGLLSLFFGAVLVIWPGAGILAVLWLIGSYAMVFGVLLVFLGFRLRHGGQAPISRPI